MINCSSRAWAEIDLTKVSHNIHEIRKLIPEKTKIMGIVKANSYGHGDIMIAKELIKCGVDFFGVSSIDEALHLRSAGIKENILILGYTPIEHFYLLHRYDLIQTLMSVEYAEKLEYYCKTENVKVSAHIKVDTGMARLGIQCKDSNCMIEDVKKLYSLSSVEVKGIFSHFSVSDSYENEEDVKFTRRQIELFDNVIEELEKAGINPGVKHLQNSYGILNFPELSYDYVRPGLLFLGITSDCEIKSLTNPHLLPIMSLKANVSLVKWVEAGDSVSYGRNYICSERKKVVTVSIGYADGIPREISNRGAKVLIKGRYAPIIGNVCMDQLMIDATDIQGVKEGDVVTIFGQDSDAYIGVDQISKLSNTINNETVCRISARVPRIYK